MKILTVSIKKRGIDTLYKMSDLVVARLIKSIGEQTIWLQKIIKSQYLSGNPLKVRTGELRRRTISLPPIHISSQGKDPVVVGRVIIGSNLSYAPVHVGPQGQVTTITPKKGKALAIPLSSAETSRGTLLGKFGKAGSLWNLHPKLFRGKAKHNLREDILYYRQGNRILPMFVLKRSVNLATKVFPDQIASQVQPAMQANVSADILTITSRFS